jgi:hypothetical protein
MAQLHFNAEEVEPANFDPLPEGKYQVVVSASEMKPTQKHDGAYLELELTVIDGAYSNRKVRARLNLANPSQAAVKIARQQLSALCRAVGVLTINDSAELHNRPLLIYVVCKPRGDGNGLTNEVRSFEALSAATASTPAPAAKPATAAPAVASPGPAPWGRPATA